MKKVLFLFCGLFLILSFANAQQDKDNKNKSNSLTITVAPTFFATLDEDLDADTFWPTSLYVTKNFMLKKRLSFSTGVHLLYNRFDQKGFIIIEFVPGYSGPIKIINKYGILDIPLRLNYHIVKPNDKLNLYAKTEIKNSFIVNYKKRDPDMYGKYGSNTKFGYNMFLGFGLGLDFKVLNRVSIVIEPGLNYSVLGMLPGIGLIDCQFGVKYGLLNN